jgi:alpha-L-fucosidase
MYHSKVDKFNIVDATPFKRDIIKELADACKKHDIKLGLYYSQEMDWREPNAIGKIWQPDKNLKETTYWENNWDFPNVEEKDFSQCFNDKIKPQVKELLTNYGDICLIWFDNGDRITPEQSQELFDLVKSCQPNCLVSSRIANGVGDYVSLGDNEVTEKDLTNVLAESPITFGSSWGFMPYDKEFKSTDKLVEIIKKLNFHGANCLLNVGPDHLGRIPANESQALREIGQKLRG